MATFYAPLRSLCSRSFPILFCHRVREFPDTRVLLPMAKCRFDCDWIATGHTTCYDTQLGFCPVRGNIQSARLGCGLSLFFTLYNMTFASPQANKKILLDFPSKLDMTRYIARRLIYSVLVLASLTVVVFFITHLIGDPARLILPLDATEAQYQALRSSLGLDLPLHIQFLRFVAQVLQGDFGKSIWQGTPALTVVFEHFPATLYLAICTILVTTLVSVPLGIACALAPRSLLDRVTGAICFTGISMPTFWLALILILVFAVRLGWFRTSGYGGLPYLVLPVLTLSAVSIGRMTQLVRTSMLDEIDKPYMTTARAKGLFKRAIIYRHALRNAAIPIITFVGYEIASLVNGAVVVEVIFGWPGIGQLIMTSIERRDFPVIQANVLVVATLIVSINLVIDIVYGLIDPRIRYS